MSKYFKVLTFVILAGLLFSSKLNSYGFPEEFEKIVKKESFSLFQKHKEKINQYVHTGELLDWAQLDPEKDGYEGTRTLTLFEYIKSRNPVIIPKDPVVAIMDTGFDTDHPELKDHLWVNEKELNGKPGVDDDENGYVDDVHGWNFLGKAVNFNLEVTRELQRMKKEGVSSNDAYYKKAKEDYDKKKQETEEIYKFAEQTFKDILKAENKLKEKNYPTDPVKVKEISSTLKGEYKEAADMLLFIKMLYGVDRNEVEKMEKDYKIKVKVLFDTVSTYSLVGDNSDLLQEKNYGDNDVFTKGETHGTHVSGIVAASKKGIGQMSSAKLMLLRVVPDEGDERDKDIGNGIRYAVDNGADIINLSAGKYFSPNSDFVAEAIKYAEEKGVLFVCAAGNEAADIEENRNFPPKYYFENGTIKYFNNMIVVGASSWMKQWSSERDPENLTDGFDLAASFSNYSHNVVDVYAPGVEINSTIPGGMFERMSGTSMAAPEVTGVAAIIKYFFPEITASQLKITLINSSRKYGELKVKMREKKNKFLFSSLSKSGGVVDAMNAYEYAMKNY